tara:strand:- start:302 stop:445 length:144 start_codon:yes stop_codon:yes gene_type:complete
MPLHLVEVMGQTAAIQQLGLMVVQVAVALVIRKTMLAVLEPKETQVG